MVDNFWVTSASPSKVPVASVPHLWSRLRRFSRPSVGFIFVNPRRLVFDFYPLSGQEIPIHVGCNGTSMRIDRKPPGGRVRSIRSRGSSRSRSIFQLYTATWCGIYPPGNDDDQHRRSGSRLAFCTVRECVPDPLPRRPERDSTTRESWVQKGQISVRTLIVGTGLIFYHQIREVDEWEKEIEEGGKYFFTR